VPVLPELEPLPEPLLVPVVVDIEPEPPVVVEVAPEVEVDEVVVPVVVEPLPELDVVEPAELPLQPASASASRADVANERVSIRRF